MLMAVTNYSCAASSTLARQHKLVEPLFHAMMRYATCCDMLCCAVPCRCP